jgi:hypothetical protein
VSDAPSAVRCLLVVCGDAALDPAHLERPGSLASRAWSQLVIAQAVGKLGALDYVLTNGERGPARWAADAADPANYAHLRRMVRVRDETAREFAELQQRATCAPVRR